MDVTLFWRILFRVVGGQVHLRKEYTIWNASTRLHNGSINLGWQPHGNVTIHNDSVEFNNGYLECFDIPIDVSQYFPYTVNISKDNQGENVSVWAEVNLPNRGTEFPIFYYPQNNANYLALSVLRRPADRSIAWKIEQEPFKQTAPYVITGTDRWHRVRVRQDTDAPPSNASASNNHYFEFLVDSLPLEREVIVGNQDGSFVFERVRKVFYIGRTPKHSLQNAGTLPDPASPADWRTLVGELRQLDCDPNDSCPSCPA